MLTQLSIRPASFSDLEFVRKTYLETRKHRKTKNQLPPREAFNSTYASIIAQPNKYPSFVAEVNDKCVGLALCTSILTFELGSHSLEIDHLFVQQQFRNRGIGTCLMDHLVNYANKHKMNGIEFSEPIITDIELNKALDRFYEKNGIEDEGRAIRHPLN